MTGRIFCLLLLLAVSTVLAADKLQPDPPFECRQCDAWNQPQVPFRIFGNTYYVGTVGLTSVLINAGDELILLDGALPQSAVHIAANISALEFDLRNVVAIGISHAHFDHAGGVAALQRFTGARVLTSPASTGALYSGEIPADDPQFAFGKERSSFPAIKNVVAVDHKEVVAIGDVELRALHTPGHTPGGISWTWRSCEGDRCLNIVYADSIGPVSAPGYRFSDGMDQKIRDSAAIIAGLDCDILLVTHPEFFGMLKKIEQGREAFQDNHACARYASNVIDMLERRLAREARQSP